MDNFNHINLTNRIENYDMKKSYELTDFLTHKYPQSSTNIQSVEIITSKGIATQGVITYYQNFEEEIRIVRNQKIKTVFEPREVTCISDELTLIGPNSNTIDTIISNIEHFFKI